MPQKRGFLAPQRNFLSLTFYHFDWTDLFLSAAIEKRSCLLTHELSGSLHLLLGVASAEQSHSLARGVDTGTVWVPGKLYKLGNTFDQGKTKQKAEKFHWKTALLPLCVHFSHLQLTLTLPIRIFLLIKKNKKRSRLHFYSPALLLFFPV